MRASTPRLTAASITGTLLDPKYQGLLGHILPGSVVSARLASTSLADRVAAVQDVLSDPLQMRPAIQAILQAHRGKQPSAPYFQEARDFSSRLAARQDKALASAALGDLREPLLKVIKENTGLVAMAHGERLQSGAWSDLRAQLAEKVAASYRDYSGWYDLGSLQSHRQINAAAEVLAAYFGTAIVEPLWAKLNAAALTQVLQEKKPELIQKYESRDPLNLVLDEQRLQGEYGNSVHGSPKRHEIFWELVAIALRKNALPEFVHQTLVASSPTALETSLAYPKLTDAEQRRYDDLMNRGVATEVETDRRLRTDLLREILHYSQAIHRTKQALAAGEAVVSDLEMMMIYEDVRQDLSLLGLRIGLSFKQMRQQIPELPLQPGRVLSMAELAERPHLVSPRQLPVAMQQRLRDLGYWQYIAAAKHIILSPELSSSEQLRNAIGDIPHGRAFALDRTIVVATQSRHEASGQLHPLDLWQLEGLAVHESAHLAWLERIMSGAAPDLETAIKLAADVPNERIAHMVEAQYYRNYLESMPMTAPERLVIEESRLDRESVVYAANIVLDLDYFDLKGYHFTLKDPRVDLGVYPTQLRAIIGSHQAKGRKRVDLERLRYHLRQRVRGILAQYESLPEKLAEQQAGGGFPGGQTFAALREMQREIREELPKIKENYENDFGINI